MINTFASGNDDVMIMMMMMIKYFLKVNELPSATFYN